MFSAPRPGHYLYANVGGKLQMNKGELLNDIEDLWSNFLQVRAAYPYARPTHIGQTFIESAPFYRQRGLNLRLEFGRQLTADDVEKLQELGYWINQSVIIRLYALLEYYGVVSETIRINTNLEGHEEVDILRRLRKYFTHTGKYNETDKDQKKLFDRIVSHFKLETHDTDRFPISIDTVITVIYNKIKRYIELI